MGKRVIIMSGYGINCETESAHAFEKAGAISDIVHINDLISGKKDMSDYDIMMFPGGFSYGDDTGSGNAYANKVRSNLWKPLVEFCQSEKLILGVCNGFQIMTHLGLFSEKLGNRISALAANNSNRYECRWVHLKTVSNRCVFTKGIKLTHLPVAHGEGRFFCSEKTMEELEKKDQIVFRYCQENGSSAKEKYPHNPNGSISDIAGICDSSGRIMGMMPHPERALFTVSAPDFHLKRELARRANKSMEKFIDSNLMIFKNAVNLR